MFSHAKIKTVRDLRDRLARLEDDREEALIAGRDVTFINDEMDAIRKTLQDVMNNICPVVQPCH